jgi:hypothetical protein
MASMVLQSENHSLTLEHVVDELFLNLAKHGTKYYDQAFELSHKFQFMGKPFVINESDLDRQILKEIAQTPPRGQKYIFTMAVSRIFENIDFDNFHHTIMRHLTVRIEK